MVTGTTAGFGLSERTAEFLSGSGVVKGFTILVHHKTGVTNRTTGEQLLWIFGIALIERNIALSFIRSAQQNIDIVRSEVYNVSWGLLILMRTMLMIEGYEL